MLDLNDFFYFVQVVERRGFTAAGRVLGMPKSTLSYRVKKLEAELGVGGLPANPPSQRYCRIVLDYCLPLGSSLIILRGIYLSAYSRRTGSDFRRLTAQERRWPILPQALPGRVHSQVFRPD
jgi:hypothetical protein